MNLDQITLQGYILALFIRDDGERFLLGSGAYEFNKKQLHFFANDYQNDIVEVQGDDGLLLAGQVRRSHEQSFDGYIGDRTVSRNDIETYRQNFLAFFRKNHYYTVVYIFHDGRAIQRQQGFIVDAPEVREIYQFMPEYHVALNFEDVNYYSYAEDSEGQEIYGKNAIIPLSVSPSDGGLVWDEYGATIQELNWTGTETVSGTDIVVDNPLNYRVPFSDVKLLGNTTVTGVPSINSPATIRMVTGMQTITVEDENNTSEFYNINLGSDELHKIGGKADNIYYDSGTWKVQQLIGAFTVSGNLVFIGSTSTTIELMLPTSNVRGSQSAASLASEAVCDKLPIGGNAANKIVGTDTSGNIRISLSKQTASTLQQASIVLAGMKVYCCLLHAATTTITGNLATQLDALAAGQLFKGQNTITVSGALKATLELSYYTESIDGEGFIWEAGSGGGVSIVDVDSIDNVYPIWEVVGPATNPRLSNITTNTTINYMGAVNAGQTLTIDMMNKTAKIAGTSVVNNITGDWVYFVKGNNRVSYTADNNDAISSTIYWQEVVG